MLVFGGIVDDRRSPSGRGYARDLWEWDGTSWRDLTPERFPVRWPVARAFLVGAFDVARDRFAIFGGSAVNVDVSRELWEYGPSP
jgi:hypothetical protein